jgi:lipopolysaccharide transport system ATP-binding protein
VHTDPVITFDHVWKKFERGEVHTSLRDLIPSLGRRLLDRGKRPVEDLRQQEFWAVRDVSFAVERGRAVGIIGPNGAGKSTALKLLTRILRPTRGRCAIRGRVGALIEVAAGFHPDLTGRENVFLQGAIMGMARAEVKHKLDAIVDFSGLHDFIDTPVKRYSSGMNARLGFSIAANLDPDALVIDEVLAVGDMAFQQRCIKRMEEFKRDGVAIVFVSHNLQAVASLCDEALFMAGEVKAYGRPDDVIRAYVAKSDDITEASNNDAIRIASTTLYDERGGPVIDAVQPGSSLRLRVVFSPTVDARDVTFGFLLFRSTDNLLVYDGHFTNAEIGLPSIKTGEPFAVDFLFKVNVTRGHYHVVTRIYDNIIQRFHAIVSPPAVLSVDELQTWDGIAHLDVKPMVVDGGQASRVCRKLASSSDAEAHPASAGGRGTTA